MVDFLWEHLNVWWLRPEQALWDSIASQRIAKYSFIQPIIDIGSGNGIFSFITAGGAFSPEYDWFVNTRLDQQDIYDARQQFRAADFITRVPSYQIDYAFDHKANLLDQALSLGFYRNGKVGDADQRLPFDDGSFQTVFSNILYWLKDLDAALREIRRILRPEGRAILCMIDSEFTTYCESYQWRKRNSEWLRRLNAGRSDCIQWMLTWDELLRHVKTAGFQVIEQEYYLSPQALQFWDVGLRPYARPLIRMSSLLSPADRRGIKQEWVKTCYDLFLPFVQAELESQPSGGLQLIYLERS